MRASARRTPPARHLPRTHVSPPAPRRAYDRSRCAGRRRHPARRSRMGSRIVRRARTSFEWRRKIPGVVVRSRLDAIQTPPLWRAQWPSTVSPDRLLETTLATAEGFPLFPLTAAALPHSATNGRLRASGDQRRAIVVDGIAAQRSVHRHGFAGSRCKRRSDRRHATNRGRVRIPPPNMWTTCSATASTSSRGAINSARLAVPAA